MKRFIIKNSDGKYLKRSGNYVKNSWVVSADDASLFTTSSGCTAIIRNLCSKGIPYEGVNVQYGRHTKDLVKWPYQVIPVNVLIYPTGVQPFIDGVLNDNC